MTYLFDIFNVQLLYWTVDESSCKFFTLLIKYDCLMMLRCGDQHLIVRKHFTLSSECWVIVELWCSVPKWSSYKQIFFISETVILCLGLCQSVVSEMKQFHTYFDIVMILTNGECGTVLVSRKADRTNTSSDSFSQL